MTDIVEFDSPLTRLKADYEAKLASMQADLDRMRENAARVEGTRDMLVLLLADMAARTAAIGAQVQSMTENITSLRTKL